MPTAGAELVDDTRFSLSLGAFITDRDTSTRLDPAGGRGTETDFEADLGLESSDTVFRLDGFLRFNPRHRVDFSVFDLSRKSTRLLQRDIQWGDTLYSVNATINVDTDLKIYKTAYTYSFISREEGFLGVTAGLYVADTTLSLADTALGQVEVGDLTAPLPVIGLRGAYKINERWILRGSAELFAISLDDVEGSLTDFYAGIEYRWLDQLSVGLALNGVNIDIDSEDDSFAGSLDWQYSGGLVFFKYNF